MPGSPSLTMMIYVLVVTVLCVLAGGGVFWWVWLGVCGCLWGPGGVGVGVWVVCGVDGQLVCLVVWLGMLTSGVVGLVSIRGGSCWPSLSLVYFAEASNSGVLVGHRR